MSSLIELVKAYQSTDRPAERMRLAEAIVEEIAGPLHDFVSRRVRPDASDDAFQDTLLAIVAGLVRVHSTSDRQFWSWCYQIAAHKCADIWRDTPDHEPLDTVGIDEVIELSVTVHPLAPGESQDLEYALELLDAAKPACRQLLWLYYVLDLDYADRCGRPPMRCSPCWRPLTWYEQHRPRPAFRRRGSPVCQRVQRRFPVAAGLARPVAWLQAIRCLSRRPPYPGDADGRFAPGAKGV